VGKGITATGMQGNESLSRHHYINLRSGRFDKTNRQDLRLLFDAFAQHKYKDHLIVHFHGGLVSEKSGLEIAARLSDTYEAAGAYPVFFVWQSQWYETIRNNLGEIFKENIFQHLLKRALQFAIAKIDQQGGQRGPQLELPPVADVERELSQTDRPFAGRDPHVLPSSAALEGSEERQFRRVLESDTRLRQLASEISASAGEETRSPGRTVASTKTLMDPDVVAEIRGDTDSAKRALPVGTLRIIKGAVAVLINVIRRFGGRRDHGLYDTVFEELLREFYVGNAGQLIWREMKKDTADAFGSDTDVYGGTAFLHELADRWSKGRRPRITLVGHSTGAIYICYLLQHASKLPVDLRFGVVLLAPAADFDLLGGTLQSQQQRIRGVRLFGMKDDLERTDALIERAPAIYRSSLLYFVSGVLEGEADKPLVGMQRFYSGKFPYSAPEFANIAKCAAYFAACSTPALMWSECSGNAGFNCRSHRHGDFDNDPVTLESVQQIIRAGF
jgi:hypothetical protein